MASKLPNKLPEVPKGWTRDLLMHLNFGHGKNGGGAATYQVKDHKGTLMPMAYQYDTRKGGLTGFTLPGIEPVMTWAELRKMWPVWLKRRRKGEKR